MYPKEFKEFDDYIRFTEKLFGNERIHVTHKEKKQKRLCEEGSL